ncbi:hypothetical protein [Brochothrix campestris]|uniref:WxL domain-containing protein n=1 Tax=Brochothrix campestris FSL F6-1037 TaxID=1265861 RepID=W7C2W0_9LIST|nr:hypothetical protein [Brochothrix campestris]EUJ31397.1 hypothetical protein BCAMP_13071 [Brochothrix campestris FSL F6-1037]
MKLAQLMAIGLTVGTIGVSVATVSADEVRDGSTAASVTLKGGELTFSEIAPTIAFEDITLTGEAQTVGAKAEAIIGINDYRGIDGNWDLTVKETAPVDAKSFTEQGLQINLAATANAGVTAETVAVSEENQLVANGSRFEHTIDLNPTLAAPKATAAGTYATTLDWTLKPAE